MNDVKNVTHGKPAITGAVWVAPAGTTLPTDAKSKLDTKFKCLGYISEDGLTNENSPESEVIKAWGGDTVLVVTTEKPDTFTYKLIEATNPEVLREVYGESNVTGTLETGITVMANSKAQPAHPYVVEMVFKNAIKRIVIPSGSLSEVGEISYVDEDAVGYETTIQCLPDASGNTHYEYILSTEKTNAGGAV